MLFNNVSLALRLTGYFGGLLLAPIGILFYLWYFGLSSWGFVGASTQSLQEAMATLEVRADKNQTFIDYNIKERRGDVFMMSTSSVLPKLLKGKGPALQTEIERLYDGLQRAYPNQYRRLVIVDPKSQRILASNLRQERGSAFDAPVLIQQAAQVGATEIITPLSSKPGSPVLAVTRQLHLQDAQGEPYGTVAGILVAYIDLQAFVGSHLSQGTSTHLNKVLETSFLLDASGDVLARFPPLETRDNLLQISTQTVQGFEGTLQQSSADGQRWLVVYRHIALSGSQGWRLVHFASEADAQEGLQTRVNTLIIAGLFLTLLALLAVILAARRIAQPLNLLTQTAILLGAGDLTARAQLKAGDSHEISILSRSFNTMAHNIQQAQNLLEFRVLERTFELQQSEKQLRLSEQDLAITLQSIGDAVITTDAAGFITRMNTTAERLTGWPLAHALGKPLPEVFQIVNAHTRLAAVNPVQRVMETGSVIGLANHTALLARDGRQYHISDSAAPIRDHEETITGVVLVFSDVTQDYQIRETLERTAILLERTGEIARVGGWELDLGNMQMYFSPVSQQISELSTQAELTLESAVAMVESQSRNAVNNAVQTAIETGMPWDLEVPMVTAKGRHIWVRFQGSAVMDGTKAVKLQGALHDITAQKILEKTEQFQRHILELLARGELLPSLLEALVRGVETLHPHMLCSILLLQSNGQKLGKSVAPSLPDFYNAALEDVEIGPGVGSCGTAAFTGKRVVVANIATHPYWENCKDLAASAGLAACWSQPIHASSGQVLGTFAIYHREPHTPDAHHIELIEQSARLASIAIERSQAARRLEESEAHYRLLTEDTLDVVWKLDANGIITYISPSDERMRGYHASEVLGQHILDLLSDNFAAKFKASMSHLAKLNEPSAQPQVDIFEVQLRCKDASLIWAEIVSKVDRDAKGEITGIHGTTRDVSRRRRADAELRIAAIAFESQEGIFVTDAQWRILRVNRAFSNITGYTFNESVGQLPAKLMRTDKHDGAFYQSIEQQIIHSRSWQGEVWISRKNAEAFPAWLMVTAVMGPDGGLTHCVVTITDITQRKANEEQIRNLAFYDPLTQLPNRRLLMDRLKKALVTSVRNQRHGALLFVDLDNFKTLNDTLGHDKGDFLLQQVAQRLSTCVRDSDTVARLGGDEFVVMLEDLSEQPLEAITQAELVGTKILAALNQNYQLAQYEHHSTPSIGITLLGTKPEDIDEPLKRADLAMYQAKAAGRNTIRCFDPQMQAVVNARARIEAGLREALTHEQFVLHYQAQVDANGRITGAEALVRWLHPELGMVSPAEFIPLAEETGLILPLGHLIMQTACLQLAHWGRQASTAHLTLSINVSPYQFHKADFVQQVMAVLAHTGACPQHLKLELTEGLMVSNVEDVIAKMTALKAHGVGFSLDDFGMGYSSLSYLKRMPLDQLKIDQTFVRDILVDPNDAAIAKMVIVLAESLGLTCIAEGVETQEQYAFLAAQGCSAYQGYWFSRPLAIEAFETLLTTTR